MGCGVSRVSSGGGGPVVPVTSLPLPPSASRSRSRSRSPSPPSQARTHNQTQQHNSLPNTARDVRLEEETFVTTLTPGEVGDHSGTPRSPSTKPAAGGTTEAHISRIGAPSLKPSVSLSRQPSGQDISVGPSRQGFNDEVSMTQNLPIARSRTFNRRSSFGGGGILGGATDEHVWKQPKQAQELINQHLADDPHCFRDHVAIYFRLENVPPPQPLAPHPSPIKLIAPLAQHPISTEPSRLTLQPSHSANLTPAGSPGLGPSPSPKPISQPSGPDQVFVFLSLGPSSGAGDKIGNSEYRTSEHSISYYPMLLPYTSLNSGDPTFSIQVQVWQKRVSSHPSPFSNNGVTMTLLGYIDVTVLNMFSSFEKGQGLLIKSPPASAMNGQTPVPLHGLMLVVDYIQFYCHTTNAVTASPSRWPSELCTPAADCLWRGQIHAIKLGVPRGCPHPHLGGSMSPANGALMLNMKEMQSSANAGVCFIQIFRQVAVFTPGADTDDPDAKPSPTASPTQNGGAPSWQLVHTSEFLPLSRNPKFAEFQRPLADICRGAYDMPLLIQVVLSHDSVRAGELLSSMAADSIYSDPAFAVSVAIKAQSLVVCSIVHTVTTMRELLAGKTKLKLHPPGMAPTQPTLDELSGVPMQLMRSTTFNTSQDPATPNTEEPTQIATGHGTLTFNISQIFSSRASLESLARARLDKSPSSDGFDELGIVRSTAYLASLLPVGRRHRPGSHLRGPSGMDHHIGMVGGGGGGHHHRSSSQLSGPPLQRSKTSGSAIGGGPITINSSPGMSTLLQKMGIAASSGPTTPSSRSSIGNKLTSPSSISSSRRSM